MIRRRIAQQARARGGAGMARDIDVPLPLKGMFADAATAEVSGAYAAKLENLRTNGVSIKMVLPWGLVHAENTRRRVPYEFGPASHYINLGSVNAEASGASIARAMAENTSVGYISAQVLMADGVGMPLRYDGAQFANAAFTTATGVAPDQFDGVLVHHDRPYFWRHEGKLEFYYGDVGAVQGPLTLFPLSRLGNITGQIASMVSLTQDASENLNDSLCIITTTGQIVIYEGTNPGDAAEWRLAGRLRAAPPVSRFGFTNVGGDIWMLTSAGLVSVLDSARQGVMALVGGLARPIGEQIKRLLATGGEWQLHTSARGEYVIVNHFRDGVAQQFIYDVEGQGWEAASYPARRWHNLGGNTEFTDAAGNLFRLDLPGGEVTATWWSSWFRLPRGSQITYLRPTIIGRGPMRVQVAVLSDHDTSAVDIAEASQTIILYSDDPADPGGSVALNEKIGIGAVGEVFQIRMSITAPEAEIVSMKAGVA